MADSKLPGRLPDSVDNMIKNFTDEGTKAIGGTLGDLWQLKVGLPIHEKRIKREIELKANIVAFAEEIEQNYAVIPESRRTEPTLLITEQALSKSQVCLEEETLRKMFAKLIARSMDSKYEEIVHPSFADIITQMSPLDAENLKLFYHRKQGWPIAEYRATDMDSGGYTALNTYVFLGNSNNQDIASQSLSMNTLQQLGLIIVSYESHSSEVGLYDIFEKHPTFLEHREMQKARDELSSNVVHMNIPEDVVQAMLDLLPKNMDILVKKGLAKLTPRGEAFLNACI